MTTLLFDIDGTLVRTGGAGKAAMETALREAFGVADYRDTVPFGGRTDPDISRDLLRVHDLPHEPDHVERLTNAYLDRLPASLTNLGGTVCPGIPELIAVLKPRPNVALGLLTGNVRAGAMKKLGYFDLWHHFSFGGFGDGHHDRDDVARSAVAAAKAHLGTDPKDVWVIGDTPLDVKCARAIGAKAIAVATGWVSLDDLKRCEPDYAFADLSDVAGVMGLWSR
jgi:phosphoglycolate phosphatase